MLKEVERGKRQTCERSVSQRLGQGRAFTSSLKEQEGSRFVGH